MVLYTTLKSNGNSLMHLTNMEGSERLECVTVELKSHLSCLASNIYFVLNTAKVKKIGNVTVKIYLNESLLSLLCFIIYGQGSFEKGMM